MDSICAFHNYHATIKYIIPLLTLQKANLISLLTYNVNKSLNDVLNK